VHLELRMRLSGGVLAFWVWFPSTTKKEEEREKGKAACTSHVWPFPWAVFVRALPLSRPAREPLTVVRLSHYYKDWDCLYNANLIKDVILSSFYIGPKLVTAPVHIKGEGITRRDE
jgi:hypothetical protein